MKKTALITLLFIATYGSALFAQQPGPRQPSQGENRLFSMLYPPDLVMRHASEVQLSDQQKKAIKTAIKEVENKSLDIKWDLRDEAEQLTGLVSEQQVNEQAVMKQADKVMTLEKEMKKMQLSLLIRIKNILTPEQKGKLQELRRNRGMQPRP
ncbi:MAG: Spy/CpxP family protein refolding chaperone [Gammaproteobacteria bacterium]